MGAADCIAYVFQPSNGNCWPLAGWSGSQIASDRTFGQVQNASTSVQNQDALDLYGFFHGHDYFAALQDFVQVSGKTIMVPKYTAGVWWSRWYDFNNLDLVKVVDDYASRAIPLDVCMFAVLCVRMYVRSIGVRHRHGLAHQG
jgi:alpha-glucosidase (family GH31 glycosyl hydrolase)